MRIARVEPLTTARALRGPFDYLLSDGIGEVGVGTVLSIPFGRRTETGVVVGLATESELPRERLVEAAAVVDDGPPAHLVELGLWVASQYCSTPARGLALVLPPGTGRRGGRVGERLRLRAAITEAGREALRGRERLGSRQRELLEALEQGSVALADLSGSGPAHGAARRLADRGLVELSTEAQRRRPATPTVGAVRDGGAPTPEQARAIAAVVAALDGEGDRRLLLHGVTGSGKTEVYLAACAAALERGRGTIVLIPEIGLAPQTVSRFRSRFGEDVALLHSRMSAGARHDEWRRLRRGEARVCVGPRSAVFAPVASLGLIVVDEEHDASYKQESDPRYDARTVAARRAAGEDAVLVCGSATPRAESWHELPRLELPRRVDGRGLPPVEVLDMRGRRGDARPLHEQAVAELAGVRERGEKAIVLLNRRGWSAFLSCRSCGAVRMCPNCAVALVLHRAAGRLSCHHCGHREAPPESCPACGSASIGRHGAGTERVEHELSELLAPLAIFRLDADTVSRDGAHAGILGAFDRAQAGVLIGTQMVAKGHDFPDVTLALVIDADATLRFPDFRAEERTFQLISQLAGRSGRGPRGGRVLVQTMAPSAEAIRSAAAHDAAGFLGAELERRRALRYPPFSTTIRIQCSAPAAEDAEALAAGLRAELDGSVPAGTDLLGPAPLFRRQGLERRHVVLKAHDREAAIDAVRASVERLVAAGASAGVRLSVDVDPQ